MLSFGSEYNNLGGTTDRADYELGIITVGGANFTERARFAGSTQHWCAVTDSGAGWVGGDDQGDYYASDFDATDGSIMDEGDPLEEVFSDAEDVVDCAVVYQVTCFVFSDGTAECAGQNSDYTLTNAYPLDYVSAGGFIIDPPAGQYWIDFHGDANVLCGEAVETFADGTSDLYCWGGDYSEWGLSPTLYLSGVKASR